MRYLVVDLEATCGESIPKFEMETIEIGAVIVTSEGELSDSLGIFIKPVRNPLLTDFCKNLTSITQSQVDCGFPFPSGLKLLYEFSRGANVMCSWGAFDLHQFKQDCRFHGIQYPFEEHWNLAGSFKALTGRKCGHTKAMRHFNIPHEGTHHRGIDDAKNIAKMVPLLEPKKHITITR